MQFTPAETLQTVLPALLRQRPGTVTDGTVLQLVVPDAGCRFHYTWKAGDLVVAEGVADHVDLTLSLVSEDLARLLDATLDFEHALKTRRMKVMGDASLLASLAASVAGGAL